MSQQLRPIKACHACGASYTADQWQELTSARFLWPIDTRVCRCGGELKLDLQALETIDMALPVDREKFRAIAQAIRAKNAPPEQTQPDQQQPEQTQSEKTRPEQPAKQFYHCGSCITDGRNTYACALSVGHEGPHENPACTWNNQQDPRNQRPPQTKPDGTTIIDAVMRAAFACLEAVAIGVADLDAKKQRKEPKP